MLLFPGEGKGPAVLQNEYHRSSRGGYLFEKIQLPARKGELGTVQIFPAGFRIVTKQTIATSALFAAFTAASVLSRPPVIPEYHSGAPGIVAEFQPDGVFPARLKGEIRQKAVFVRHSPAVE